ncbi:unnamed protein product, partial [Effrenium voratum]
AQTEQERLKEGCAINQSLSQLGLVIKMLTEQHSGGMKAPMFRASKLTFLLKDSLAGNSKTCMMATISPASDNYDESISTLRFASSVKSIKTVAVQNKNKKDQLIDNLQQEMQLLKAQMAAGGLNVAEASEQLKERERLIKEQLQQNFEDELKAARDMTRAREKVLEESGLSHGHITEAFGITEGQPYMVNMAFDPMLAGCLIYLIQENKSTTMGAHKDNTIVLKGLGMPEFLCKIDLLSQVSSPVSEQRCRSKSEVPSPSWAKTLGSVSLTRLSEGARVAVNGKLVEPGQSRDLHNGDQIFLGRAYVLKLVCPGEGAAPLMDDLVLQKDETDTAELENSESWKSLQDYVGQVVRQMSSTMASQLMEEIKLACRLTDEANEITKECKKKDPLHFEVDLTSTYPPCVAIRVLYCEHGRENMDEELVKNRYIWSVHQLSERLERMRDYWLECQKHGGEPVELPRLEDPWHEAEPTEIFQRMRHLESMVAEAERAFKVPLMGRMSKLLKIAFVRWRYLTGKRERASGRSTTSGRAALVKSTTSGRMRTTIIADRPFGSRRLKVEKTPTSSRRMTLKLSPEKSPEKEKQEGTTPSTKASIVESPSLAKLEPEAAPDNVAELQRQLDESCQHKASLEHQLEVAYDLIGELRGHLVETLEPESGREAPPRLPEPTAEPEPEDSRKKEKVTRRSQGSQGLLARADALAAATRAAVDAAKAVQLAKFQSGIAALPFSSPRLAVKQRVQVQGEPVSRSMSPALTPSPASYRSIPSPTGRAAAPFAVPLDRSLRLVRSAVRHTGQSCQAVPQCWQPLPGQPTPLQRLPGQPLLGQLAYTTSSPHSFVDTSPASSPRGRPVQRVVRAPSASPRVGAFTPRMAEPLAPRAAEPSASPRTSSAPQLQPTQNVLPVPLHAMKTLRKHLPQSNASWLYSQPGLQPEALHPDGTLKSLPKRRPSSGTLTELKMAHRLAQAEMKQETGEDGDDGVGAQWVACPRLDDKAQCLQVAPDMYLVRVPSSQPDSASVEDSLSSTLRAPR